ncbi:LysR substrate-binding domain-containing protein [Alcaligenes faecalis]|uniref:LysR substrate-binding domain-containing protein n=1 Tax=Alcaligenes faecalis TaxID=511 RepID=UPI001C9AE8B4|nr:LysR substrate-binding domain-containing protein [Alcaligenes faecalis]MBY6310144.1 LysR family transcriptional regulator [Alcaligenes faecalis]MBY6318230.1 LysR family transcriptional regulator [Alcaligenes faecalis]MBY6392312.1 LysR family transcriptional regulator [Alcaligenes faecalis]
MSEDLDPTLQQARQRWQQVARFKLRHLVLLDAIGELQNLRLAAEHTYMTQPAASRMLKHIESLLGMPLFKRGKHGLRPNPEGELMIRYARRMINDLQAAQHELQQREGGLTGSIKVGAVQSSASQILPRSVARLLSQHPGLHISIQEGESHMLADALRAGKLDLLVGRLNTGSTHHELNVEILSTEPFVVVANCHHPFAKRSQVQAHELVAERWILPPRSTPIRHVFDSLFIKNIQQTPERVIDSVSLSFNQVLLQEMQCLAILPRTTALSLEKQGLLRILSFELGQLFGALTIVTLKNGIPRGGVQALIQTLRNTAVQEQTDPPSNLKSTDAP